MYTLGKAAAWSADLARRTLPPSAKGLYARFMWWPPCFAPPSKTGIA